MSFLANQPIFSYRGKLVGWLTNHSSSAATVVYDLFIALVQMKAGLAPLMMQIWE